MMAGLLQLGQAHGLADAETGDAGYQRQQGQPRQQQPEFADPEFADTAHKRHGAVRHG